MKNEFDHIGPRIRPYYKSSSFIMALLFTLLLGLSSGLILYFNYHFNRADFTSDAAFNALQYLSTLSIILMAMVIVTSFIISTFVVSRTNRIARTAQEIIQTGNLSRRINVHSRWDDLSNMTYVLNSLLIRIEHLVQNITHVTDNIAHDLRTPLTRLLNQLETLRSQNPDDEIKKVYDTMIAEADGLLHTFNALLRISRIEAGQQKNFISLNLHDLISDVIELYDPLAEAKDISMIYLHVPVVCMGDRDLLFQIFANLLDNAVKFTPDGGTIQIDLTADAGYAHIMVTDNGPGIADTEKIKVFDRFYRTEQSRSTPGNGLGLSLVSSAVHLHGGNITLVDADPGLCVAIKLPLTHKITNL